MSHLDASKDSPDASFGGGLAFVLVGEIREDKVLEDEVCQPDQRHCNTSNQTDRAISRWRKQKSIQWYTYMRFTLSTFMAGSKVKVLMTRQLTAQVRLRDGCDCMKDRPYAAGQSAPKAKMPVKISR